MIGLDTNVLVRYFVKDDPDQTERAVSLIRTLTPTEPGYVGLAVLIELIWVITRRYRMKRDAVSRSLAILLASREMIVEQSDTVRAALQLYRSGNAGFADCLIAASAKAAGCSRTVTFDRIASRDAGMEWIGQDTGQSSRS